MKVTTLELLTQQLALHDQLSAGRSQMLEPQDLPGRFGRVVRAVDVLLEAVGCEAVLAGGWAVWRHGYTARVTQDIDIVLAADQVDDFLRVASVSGFRILPQPEGRWPKVLHKQTDIRLDILPEGARPGSSSNPAPTTIGHPSEMGGSGTHLRYIRLPSLVELKVAAGRARDEFDVVELVRENANRVDSIREHLVTVHPDYVAAFDQLVQRAREQEDH